MTVSERQRPARYAPTPWAERKLYRPFLRVALVLALTLGFTLGSAMLGEHALGRSALPWSESMEVHATAQVYGWAGLFIIGIASHIVPRFRGNARITFPWPQRATLWLVVAGIVLNVAAHVALEPNRDGDAGRVVLIVSGLALLGGITTFAWTLSGVLCRGTRSAIPFERWLWCGLAFGIAGTALQCVRALLIGHSSPVSPEAVAQASVAAGMFGFIGNFLFGISLRATAGFLHLRPPRARLERVAFVVVNAGAVAITVAEAVDASVSLAAASTLLYAFGVVLFVAALRIFEPATAPQTDWRSARFLVTAYGWLLVAAATLAVTAFGDLMNEPVTLLALPALHTFAMGFITMTIFGFTARVLPLLEGRPLPTPRLADVAFALLNVSVLLRLAGSLGHGQASTATLALSGVLGLAALGCFVPIVWPLTGGSRSGAARTRRGRPVMEAAED